VACSVEEVEIDYGKDDCAFCKMKIVDKKFAAEIVNEHGKAFKFDAIECMLRFIKMDMIDKRSISLMFVSTFTNENEFIKAEDASYVISQDIPSPMGAFLSAYTVVKEANSAINGKQGDVMDWKGLLKRFDLNL
jgi:copper chaperone NosL